MSFIECWLHHAVRFITESSVPSTYAFQSSVSSTILCHFAPQGSATSACGTSQSDLVPEYIVLSKATSSLLQTRQQF